jgi:hypothetical protein
MCTASAVSHDRKTGAPGNEIEITPEMVRAGAAALFDGTELESYLSPTTAELVAQNVLWAALRTAYNKTD